MKCPMCGKPTAWKDNPDRPFCSERCRMIDLGNWVTGSYAVSIPLTDIDESAEQRIESPEGSDA
ncbi:MAG: DNA gyrase inhibitor YacG [Acidobacteriota bacterium]